MEGAGSEVGRGRGRLLRFAEPGLEGIVVRFSTTGKAELEIAGLSESCRRSSGGWWDKVRSDSLDVGNFHLRANGNGSE